MTVRDAAPSVSRRHVKARPSRAQAMLNRMAGRYYILREGERDTGCMLTLEDRARGSGGNAAVLGPACRDQGVVIFDPVGWQIVGDRLVLIARKGHKTHFDHQADGTWAKDAHEGKALILKKI